MITIITSIAMAVAITITIIVCNPRAALTEFATHVALCSSSATWPSCVFTVLDLSSQCDKATMAE